MKYDVVFFDIGRVLVDFSHERMFSQMAAATGLTVEDVQRLLTTEGLQERYEKGLMETDAVFECFRREARRDVTPEEFYRATSDIFREKTEMHVLLEALRARGVKLVLASNTCEAHMRWERTHSRYFEWFDAAVLSYEIGAMKPEPAFYEAMERAGGHPRERCWFTDDLAANVAGAREFGFHAEVYTDAASTARQLGLGPPARAPK